MDNGATITVKTTDWKIKIVLGVSAIAAITLIVLAIVYRDVIAAGLLVAMSITGGGGLIWLGFKARKYYILAQHDIRRSEAETSKLESEAVAARIAAHFYESKTGVFLIDHPDEIIKIKQFYPAVSASKPMADIPQLPSPHIRKLLDVDWTHMLITGPTGVGKSTVACWLIDSVGAVVYVLDPHANQNARKGLVWPGHAIVVGDGRDWLAIDSKLVELLGQMDTRYRQTGPFDPVLIVSDEWLSVRENCEHAGEFFETIGSEARKVDMQLLIMTVAATVDDLKCSAAVRDNLVQLRLDLALKAQNRGELKWGKGNVELVELPGRYKQLPARADELLPPIEYDEGPSAEMPPADELELVRLIDSGVSPYAAYKQVYSVAPGGSQYEDIRVILRKFGRDV